jgi:PEP-CTERM motif
MRHLAHSAIAAALVVLSITPARADTVQFLGYSHGSLGVDFQIFGPTPTSGSTGAGGFLTKLNGLDPAFTTYCIDLYQYIAFNQPPYDYTNVPASAHLFRNAGAAQDLARLYSSGHLVDSAVTEAAFQLAVWEIAYEKTGSAYDLGSGDASFTGAAGTLALASGWLASLSSHGAGPGINVLESPGQQDVIYAAVPEPETYALLLAGLAAVGGVARRRKDVRRG